MHEIPQASMSEICSQRVTKLFMLHCPFHRQMFKDGMHNRQAAGTLISRDRDMSKALMTSIVLKSDVTLMDIVSTRMLGQFGFLAKIFNIFKDQQISVDVVATSEIAVSLTLDPR